MAGEGVLEDDGVQEGRASSPSVDERVTWLKLFWEAGNCQCYVTIS